MRLLPKGTVPSIVLIALLALILVALAALQYRWSGQVSESVHERMQANLLASMNQFRMQFNGEFRQLGFLLQPDTSILIHGDWKSYAESCSSALAASEIPLVRNVCLWISEGPGSSGLLILNRQARNFEPISWPDNFKIVRSRYAGSFALQRQPGPGMRPFEWTMIHQVPMLLRPLLESRPSPDAPGLRRPLVGYLMAELSLEVIQQKLLPELAHRHFTGPEGFNFQVAVLKGRNPGDIVYRSDPGLSAAAFEHPDARIPLIENSRERFGRRASEGPARPADQAVARPPQIPFDPAFPPREAPGEGPGMVPILSEDDGSNWELVAKHREGSLEAAVTGLRRRNLAISFGSLILLGMSMALIIVSARRAQRLARLQMDFVAGVSHELRTPLAVICSAGDNLADGVADDSSRSARKYGDLIRNEGRKLAGMIDQILQFAGIQSGRRRYNLHPARVNEITNAVLEQAMPIAAAAGFTLEKSLASDLPMIRADSAVLSRAIQNLIQNALKYSGDSRWLAVRTEKSVSRHGMEARIIVEDRGTGIDKEELSHLFEPFYRGRAASDAQIHGAGLGLFMVKESLAGMGGSISVESMPGKGSAFTIHLPGLPENNEYAAAAASGWEDSHAV
jgi:signal transduction histidine kinase